MPRRLRLLAIAAGMLGLATLFGVPSQAPELPENPTGEEVLECARSNLVEGTFHGMIGLQLIRPDYAKAFLLEAWTKGGDRALIRVREPQEQAGSGYLRVEDELWFYDPGAGQAIPLPTSALSENFLGADLSLEDFYRGTLADQFDVEILGTRAASEEESSAEADKIHTLRLTPKPEAPVVYGKIEILVRDSDCATLEADYYDQRDSLIRQAVFSDFVQVGEGEDRRVVPLKMVFDDMIKEGSRTIETIESYEFDIDLPEQIFTVDCLTRGKCGSS